MSFTYATAGQGRVSAANRFGMDYRAEASRLPRLGYGIIDAHAHINGPGVIPIWREAARLYGVERVATMVRLEDAGAVREALGDMVEFIAFPDFRGDRGHAMREGFLEDIRRFHDEFGSRMVKLWNAPRMHEFFEGDAAREVVPFDSPWRVRHAELAESLGMMFMVHVADPDTWFSTRYADARKYGTKLDQYRSLRVMMDRFRGPWLAAHMGGWPEDLAFLSGLLEAHGNLYLDTSATKWMVRELSLHPRGEVVEFLERWRGRVIFGSDIVTTDEHLTPKTAAQKAHPMGELADGPEAAFDLYASRYWALRTMWETDYEGPSPIADPDLMMTDAARYGPMDAPVLRGLGLGPGLLRELYRDAALRLYAGVDAGRTA